METSYGLNVLGFEPRKGKSFCLLHSVQTGPGAHPSSNTMKTGALSPGGKATRETCRSLTLIWRRGYRLFLYSPSMPLVTCYGATFTFIILKEFIPLCCDIVINMCIAVKQNKLLLNSSVKATCFGIRNHLQAIKYMM